MGVGSWAVRHGRVMTLNLSLLTVPDFSLHTSTSTSTWRQEASTLAGPTCDHGLGRRKKVADCPPAPAAARQVPRLAQNPASTSSHLPRWTDMGGLVGRRRGGGTPGSYVALRVLTAGFFAAERGPLSAPPPPHDLSPLLHTSTSQLSPLALPSRAHLPPRHAPGSLPWWWMPRLPLLSTGQSAATGARTSDCL